MNARVVVLGGGAWGTALAVHLATRSTVGVDVTLYWHPTLDELIVCVWDERHGAYFEIRPQRYLALDVYYHPYAYADLADEYEKEDRRAA